MQDILYTAASHDKCDIIKWLLEQGCEWKPSYYYGVIQNENLSFMKWLQNNKHNFGADELEFALSLEKYKIVDYLLANNCPFKKTTMSVAARTGNLEMVKLFKEKKCCWDGLTREAAVGGHLHIIEWARSNGCPWDTETCSTAIKQGHLNILYWAVDNGCPIDEKTLAVAVDCSDIKVLIYLKDRGCSLNTTTFHAAARSGRLDVMEYIVKLIPYTKNL